MSWPTCSLSTSKEMQNSMSSKFHKDKTMYIFYDHALGLRTILEELCTNNLIISSQSLKKVMSQHFFESCFQMTIWGPRNKSHIQVTNSVSFQSNTDKLIKIRICFPELLISYSLGQIVCKSSPDGPLIKLRSWLQIQLPVTGGSKGQLPRWFSFITRSHQNTLQFLQKITASLQLYCPHVWP